MVSLNNLQQFELTIKPAKEEEESGLTSLHFEAESGGAKADAPVTFDLAAFEAPPLESFSHLSLIAMVSGFALNQAVYAESSMDALVLPTLQAPVFIDPMVNTVEISGVFMPDAAPSSPEDVLQKSLIMGDQVDQVPVDAAEEPPTTPEAAPPTTPTDDVPDVLAPPTSTDTPLPPSLSDPNVDIFTPTGPSLPALFTEFGDIIDFNVILAGSYADGTQYDALGGSDMVTLPLNAAAATASGFVEDTPFFGGAGADTITGGDLGDYIDGGLGSDTISSGMGNDVLVYDSLVGDSIDGGAGTDTLLVSGTGITLDLAAPLGTLAGIEAFVLDGSMVEIHTTTVDLDALSGATTFIFEGDSTLDNFLIIDEDTLGGETWMMSGVIAGYDVYTNAGVATLLTIHASNTMDNTLNVFII